MAVESFDLFGSESAVGLDDLLKRIPAGVEPQDVDLILRMRGVETDVLVTWDGPA